MLRSLLALSLVLATGCRSVEWAAPEADLPDGWRHYRLFVGDAAFVLARNERAAAQAHEFVADARDVIAGSLESEVGRGLILALSFNDPLPIEDPEAYRDTLAEWQRRTTGHSSIDRGGAIGLPKTKTGETIELDPRLPLRLICSAIPPDDEALDLPRELVERATFVAVLPTKSCISETADELVAIACRANGISPLMLTLASVAGQHPATQMRELMTETATESLYDTWLSALEVGPEVAFSVKQRGGLIDEDEVWSAPRAPSPRGSDWHELITPDRKFPAQGMAMFSAGPRPDDDLMPLLVPATWRSYVDCGMEPDPQTRSALEAAGKNYLHLPMASALPTREQAQRLGAFEDEVGGVVFVYGDKEFTGALVASHAYYVLGKSPEEALDVAEYYGAGRLLPALAEEFDRDR